MVLVSLRTLHGCIHTDAHHAHRICTACVHLMGCWLARPFQMGRTKARALAHRAKANVAVQKSKDCPYKFATKLPVPSGNATWHVPEKIPDSTIFIRAWLWNQQPDGTFKQANFGRTKTYLEVLSLPSSLLCHAAL